MSDAPRPGTTSGAFLSFGVGEQLFLGLAAGEGQRVELPRVELLAFRGQALADGVRQGQVHVVAAEQNVVAHGHARQLHFAVLFR